ncbi:MAG: acylphosphatase [Desulfobacterales bacterium]|nr:acylphosphatase [Desulfobacterales bacterium]MDD4463865.1 acylphosphatase [Desulfobacterales bacterium]MDY0377367.1 acylphosphatase [Desulfobacterales bacterium]
MKKRVRAHVIIHGRVQGVFFRAETRKMADALGIRGWARNNPDGTVEALFEADEETVAEMLKWCRRGPPYAAVTDVVLRWEEYQGEFSGFEIRYQ